MSNKNLNAPSNFEREYMNHFGGMNKIDQGLFRFFLRWLDGELAKSSAGLQAGHGIDVQNIGDIPVVAVDLSQLVDGETIVEEDGKIKSKSKIQLVEKGGLQFITDGEGNVLLDTEKSPADILAVEETDEVNDNSTVTYLTLKNFFDYLKMVLTENVYLERKEETVGEGVEAETREYFEIKTKTLDDTRRLSGVVWYDKENHKLIFAPSREEEDEDKRTHFSIATYEDLDELRHEEMSSDEVEEIFDSVFNED